MIVGSPFGTAAVITSVVATYITLYDGVTSLRHIDTGTHMLAGMMNNDASWTGLGIHPYVQLRDGGGTRQHECNRDDKTGCDTPQVFHEHTPLLVFSGTSITMLVEALTLTRLRKATPTEMAHRVERIVSSR